MKRLLSILGVLGICVLIPSCQRDRLDEPQLVLATGQTLSLGHEASEQVIPLETNQKQWTAITDVEWLEAVPAGKNLLLRALENPSMAGRRGQVVVTAGGLTTSILVEQKGQDVLTIDLGLSNSSLLVEKEGGDMRLVLKSNSRDWSATSDQDWLQVLARPRNGELVLRIDANKTTETRIGNITIQSEGKTQQIQIKQKGLLHYYLPYSLWGENYTKIEKLENARGSKIHTLPNAQARPAIPDYTFSTLSAVFPQVKYEFVSYGSDMLYATTLISGGVAEVYNDAFYQFLVEEGYQRISPADKVDGQIEYIHDTQKIRLYITKQVLNNAEVAVVYLYPIREQAEPQETLATFDPGLTEFGIATRTRVEEWEESNGGKFDAEFGGVVGLPFWFAPDPLLGRAYFFEEKKDTDPADYQPTFNKTLQLYRTHKVAFYKYGALDFVTREWTDLMAREGYTFGFFEPSGRTYRYYHNQKRIGIAIKSLPFAVHTFLLVNLFPLPTGRAANAVTGEAVAKRTTLLHQQLSSRYDIVGR